MMMDSFFDDKFPYSVSSYYYRVEFQQKGAPNIHCLLWLQDEEGIPAPTFWTTDGDEQDGLEETENFDDKLNCFKSEQILKMSKSVKKVTFQIVKNVILLKMISKNA